MTERGTTLAAIQVATGCEHAVTLGVPCSYGGWATCGCDVMHWKANAPASGEAERSKMEDGT